MSPEVYARLRAEVAAAGYAGEIAWSGSVAPVNDADAFGREFAFMVCNSGMKAQIARGIFERVMLALETGASAATVFGHKGKAGAIDRVWHDRARHLAGYLRAGTPAAQLAYLESLPWIGGITNGIWPRISGSMWPSPTGTSYALRPRMGSPSMRCVGTLPRPPGIGSRPSTRSSGRPAISGSWSCRRAGAGGDVNRAI